MQFAEKIVSINQRDKVLEIGPGGNHFERADVFLELALSDEDLAAQRGHAEKATIDPGKIVYYDGKKFPFKDKEFDYVICSHVVEHVTDLPSFMREMFRVAKMGYIEYPTIYYEYLYNFDVHINFVKTDLKKKRMYYLPKSKTSFNEFRIVQEFFYESLVQGYAGLVEDLHNYMFEGFEWHKPFEVSLVHNLSQLTFEAVKILPRNNHLDISIRQAARIIIDKVLMRAIR